MRRRKVGKEELRKKGEREGDRGSKVKGRRGRGNGGDLKGKVDG